MRGCLVNLVFPVRARTLDGVKRNQTLDFKEGARRINEDRQKGCAKVSWLPEGDKGF